MQFIQPTLFKEALAKLGQRALRPSAPDFASAQWQAVPVALRERAFFSSRVESARVLQRGRDAIADFLAGNREQLATGDTVLKTGSRADFVKQMQDFLQSEGVQRGDGGLRDVTSETRLNLVFDVHTRAAQDYGYWLQGQDTDILDEFPAQRFIRVIDVQEPRTSHSDAEGAVALKSDLDFWTRLNEDFGVPWGPWGWGCGHDVEDVDRAEAEALGLIAPGEKPRPAVKDFNERLQSSAQNLDDDMLAFLENAFGDRIEIDRAARSVKWR